jgi:tripartite ATP-independent transporter DctM subunit
MRRYGYDDELSTGSVASGGGLGMIMPPSVVMIVYGVLTEQSIGALFVSGIIPALVMMVLYMITIYIKCIQHPHLGPPGEKFTWAEKFNSLKDMADTALCFIVVMGGLFFGVFTPTEAAGIGAFSVLAVSVIRKQLGWKGFVKSLYEALRTSCMVIFLIAGALVFGKFLAITRIPFNAASWITDMNMPNFMVLAAIVIIYIIGGCIMDILALIMLTIPVFYPVILNMGYDPIWYGIVIVLLAQIGVITPPVGINVYVVYGVAQGTIGKVPLEKIFKGVMPFLIATILGIILMTVFPQIILVLPRLMY